MKQITLISNRCRPDDFFKLSWKRFLLPFFLATLLLLILMPMAALADGFDGSQPLVGTSHRIIEINQHKIIDGIDHDTAGIPKKFQIDFKTNTLRPSKDSLVRKTIVFDRVAHHEDKMVIQGIDGGIVGVDDAMAWSLIISKKNGKAVLAASDGNLAYVIFGVLTTAGRVP